MFLPSEVVEGLCPLRVSLDFGWGKQQLQNPCSESLIARIFQINEILPLDNLFCGLNISSQKLGHKVMFFSIPFDS